MPKVTVYSGPNCPYCVRAKALLKRKGVDFEDIDVKADPAKLEEMIQRTGGRKTIPQIFIDGKHVGDSDALHALDADGGLDPLLAS